MSRAVAVGYPHHITQRGNYRQSVFSDADDYAHYLKWLAQYARKYGLEIWAYCLMPNHVHFVGVPAAADSLARTFNTVHMQYAQYYNQKREAKGHLWQGRFFSCVLDERHTYAAVRYVELNPVRGGMVASPEEYPWSSAKSHVTGFSDPVLSGRCFLMETLKDWRQYLGEEKDPDAQKKVIEATNSGHPCGADVFVRQMEAVIGRRFIPRPAGRPRGSIKVEEKSGADGGRAEAAENPLFSDS
ncbi:MAG: transposase [Pseudomonadota bacterium]|nr:transposase [Pseudomonadota bacterium]